VGVDTRGEGPPRTPQLHVVSVSVAMPSRLGVRRGRVVDSAIAKRPVLADSLWLDWTNLSGDKQGDPRAHGGVDKTVYCYAFEHYAAWEQEIPSLAGPPPRFGENLTLSGGLESQVCVGDVWRWGDAVVQVAQPRHPCFKLAMHTGVADIEQRLVTAGRCGWYLRVLRPGEVPTRGGVTVEHRDDARLSVLDAHRAFSSDDLRDMARIDALLELDTLADAWKRMLRRRLAVVENRAS
jgi:MOSC domain-containing protein YiiM